MSEPQDNQLIAEYSAHRSEDAFAALVRQHINLVFATAMRQVGNRPAAEEITQNVFVALAQASGKLKSHPTIAGWLHRTTLNKCREWLRSELRRHHREQVAVERGLAAMEGGSVWSPLVPLLDEALLGLRDTDRQAVILHYMEGRTFQEVGSTLGVAEDTVRKRVNRCLDDLTHFFRRRGFDVPLAVGPPLFSLSLHSAPAGLAASATSAGMALAHSASTSTLTFIKFMAWTKTKTAIITGAVALLTVGGGTITWHAVRVAETEVGLTKMQGSWEGTWQAGPETLRVVLKLGKTNDTFYVLMDSVDQGTKNTPFLPISATPHSLHIGLPARDMDYQATLSPDGNQLSGRLVEGKHAFPLTLVRTATPDTVIQLTPDQYAPRLGSDLQGQWQATVMDGKSPYRMNLRIAEPSPGIFLGQMDFVDGNAMDMLVTSFVYDKPDVHFQLASIGSDFAGKLDYAGDRITGTWKQPGSKMPVTFTRVQPAAVAALEAQKDYGDGSSTQIQGHWIGHIMITGMPFHVRFNIALMPDGSYTATLDSIDQGVTAYPATSAECSSNNVRLAWKSDDADYTGNLTHGKIIGIWHQGKVSVPFNLERDLSE